MKLLTTIINELFSLDNHTEYDSLDTCIDDAVLESNDLFSIARLVRGLDAQPKKCGKSKTTVQLLMLSSTPSEVRKDDRRKTSPVDRLAW
jgi:hypothetical protein